MKRKRKQTKTKGSGQFSSFALVILAVALLVVIVMKFGGSGDNSPITYNPTVEAAVPAGAYVTIGAERLDQSVGWMYYSDGTSAPTKLTDYRYTQPVIAGSAIYAIRYQGTTFQNFMLDPIRYDITTGVVTSLAPQTQPGQYNGWYMGIDATYNSSTDTTVYAYSTNNKIVAKKIYPYSGGYRTSTIRTVYGGIIGQPSVSGDGQYMAYVSSNKTRLQKLSSYSSTVVSSSGNPSSPITNGDGSKVGYIVRQYPGNDKVAIWDRTTKQTAIVSLADTYTARFLDMNSAGTMVWQATRTGSSSIAHIYAYNGTSTTDLTPEATSTNDPVRITSTISDANRVMHASSQKKIYSGTTSGGDSIVIATLPYFPQWLKLNRSY